MQATGVTPALTRLAVLAALAAFAFGCGADSSPTAAVDDPVFDPSPAAKKAKGLADNGDKKKAQGTGDDPTYEAYSAPKANGKTEDSRVISELFGSRGGKITVEQEDLKITFEVPKGAVKKNTLIEMTVKGDSAKDLDVSFGPSGLLFQKLCTLDIKLYGRAIDVKIEEIEAVHVGADGTEDTAGIESVAYYPETDHLHVEIEVPGFSRYLIRRR